MEEWSILKKLYQPERNVLASLQAERPSVQEQCILVILVALCLLMFVSPTASPQRTSDHIVISEVQIADDEFIELYNPTDALATLRGWHLCYFPSSREAWYKPYRNKAFPSNALVRAHGFYLIGLNGYSKTNGKLLVDWQVYSSAQLSNKAGTVAVFRAQPSEDTLVDAVAWGDVLLREGEPACVPRAGQSIARMSLPGKFTPCQDTNNNASDFVLQEQATPGNSSIAVTAALAPEKREPSLERVLAYTVPVCNRGTNEDTYAFSAMDELGWELEWEPGVLMIPPGGCAKFRFRVTIPKAIEFFALDLETTGYTPRVDEIIEIAWVRFRDTKIEDRFTSLVRPELLWIPTEVTQVTGLSVQDLVSAPPIEDILPGILQTLVGKVVVTHSTNDFDRRFIETAAQRLGLEMPEIHWQNTYELSRVVYPGQPSYSLDALCAVLDLPPQTHRALPDAEAVGALYLSCSEKLGNAITVDISSCARQNVRARAITKIHLDWSNQ